MAASIRGHSKSPQRKRLKVDTYYQDLDCETETREPISYAEESSSRGNLSKLPTQITPQGKEQVCFGMIAQIPIDKVEQKALGLASIETVILEFKDQDRKASVISCTNGSLIGTVGEQDTIVFSSIAREPFMEIQPILHNDTKRSIASLSLILYGPLDEFNELGTYLTEQRRFLQQPHGCYHNLQYRNPHLLSGLDHIVPSTFDLHQPQVVAKETLSVLPRQTDVLNGLESNQAITEAETPKLLKTYLYSHQKQALSYMLGREKGWNFVNDQDIWSLSNDPCGSVCYKNNITGRSQPEQPIDFRGGIIADEMGLGKTLSILALVASDKEDGLLNVPMTEHQRPSRATLLVVPSSVLDTWETELVKHVRPGELQWVKHYKNSKIQGNRDVSTVEYDLVLTTPMTVISEYRRPSRQTSILFNTCWRRIVVDEAHCIRNLATLSSRAITAIQAPRRWAVTGTPVQNRLNDFASLLRFLKAYPYDSKEVFQSDIIDCWNMLEGEEGIARLKKLAQAIMLRRSKTKIQLPERHDILSELSFPPEEAERYEGIETAIARSLEADLDAEKLPTRSYTNALMRINMLRRFCDVGLRACPDLDRLKGNFHVTRGLEWATDEAQEAFDNLTAFGPVCCSRCGLEDRVDIEVAGEPKSGARQLAQCLKFLCSDCSALSFQRAICDHQPPCPVASLDTTPPSTPQHIPEQEVDVVLKQLPTKIQAITEELKATKDEKSVVFSFWRSTLDLVQSSLHKEGIRLVRVDGTIARERRSRLFDEFRNDTGLNVLLLSFSCGSEGLDLTAASRCYLLEPQWNPTLEEQALARVHRLGQTRTVTTVRFIMRGTIEEQMVELQNRKKHLAELMLSESQASAEHSNRNRLHHLRSLLR